MRLSSADHATEDTFLVYSLKIRRGCPVAALQTCTVASSLPEAMCLPSCDQATAPTLSRCPVKCVIILPLATAYTCTVPSLQARARALSSGAQARALICADILP